MAKININLSIAGKSYPMSIEQEKEELYREAARRLNEKVREFTRVPSLDQTDRLAMAALRFSIVALSSERSGRLGSAETESLEALSQRLDSYLG